MEEAQQKLGMKDAILTAEGRLNGRAVICCSMEFGFIGGSMGAVVGEKVARAIERSLAQKQPLIIVSCSGGARMMEGTVSLMQLAKVSAALARLDEARVPYISVLTDPTTGGVTASFAMLGDLNIAEPGALIGFAGPRVIEQTIRSEAARRLSDGRISARTRLSRRRRLAQRHECLHRPRARLFPPIAMNYDESVRSLFTTRPRAGRSAPGPPGEIRTQQHHDPRRRTRQSASRHTLRRTSPEPMAKVQRRPCSNQFCARLACAPALYTSPHLERINERIRIDGEGISRTLSSPRLDSRALFDRTADGVRQARRPSRHFLSASRQWHSLGFAEHRVDFACTKSAWVAAFDATNIVQPEIAVITPIDFDHENFLGHSIEEIAGEKAGIIKSGH